MDSRPGCTRKPYRVTDRKRLGHMNVERTLEVAEAIRRRPNQLPSYYAALVGIDHRAIGRILVNCETLGIPLAEDGDGRLLVLGDATL